MAQPASNADDAKMVSKSPGSGIALSKEPNFDLLIRYHLVYQ